MEPLPVELEAELKKLIVETLRLEDVTPADIGDEMPLFAPRPPGLGLDSLSALELLTAVEYRFGVRFDNDGTAKHHFESVSTLARFVRQARA